MPVAVFLVRSSMGLISNICIIDHLGRRTCAGVAINMARARRRPLRNCRTGVAPRPLECGFSVACFPLPGAPERAGVYSLTIRESLSLCVDMSRDMHANNMGSHHLLPVLPSFASIGQGPGSSAFLEKPSGICRPHPVYSGEPIYADQSLRTVKFCCHLPCPVC